MISDFGGLVGSAGRVFNTDPTLRPSKLGPQAPAANLKPPSVTATARVQVQVQTNKFFSLEMPDPAKVKKLQPSTSSKRNKEEDEDDLPFLVGEKVYAKATNGAGAGAGAPATENRAPDVSTTPEEVMVEADDEGDVESKPSLSLIEG